MRLLLGVRFESGPYSEGTFLKKKKENIAEGFVYYTSGKSSADPSSSTSGCGPEVDGDNEEIMHICARILFFKGLVGKYAL